MMTKMKEMNVLIYQVTRFARDNNFDNFDKQNDQIFAYTKETYICGKQK